MKEKGNVAKPVWKAGNKSINQSKTVVTLAGSEISLVTEKVCFQGLFIDSELSPPPSSKGSRA